MDQIIATGGLTVTLEAMLNHPVLKKGGVLASLTDTWPHMTVDPCFCPRIGYKARKAGVIQVLVLVAAFTKAETRPEWTPMLHLSDNHVIVDIIHVSNHALQVLS